MLQANQVFWGVLFLGFVNCKSLFVSPDEHDEKKERWGLYLKKNEREREREREGWKGRRDKVRGEKGDGAWMHYIQVGAPQYVLLKMEKLKRKGK